MEPRQEPPNPVDPATPVTDEWGLPIQPSSLTTAEDVELGFTTSDDTEAW